ncbi:hypothetical protein PSEUDO8O_50222 [Pseudomonas sp. 8O]|nr:hypothetical protein PSEUDO8O_50222 [Pseudomonas sp. 8O]
MNVMVCDGVWESAGQTLVFVRTLCTAALSETSLAGLTAEDHAPLREHPPPSPVASSCGVGTC